MTKRFDPAALPPRSRTMRQEDRMVLAVFLIGLLTGVVLTSITMLALAA